MIRCLTAQPAPRTEVKPEGGGGTRPEELLSTRSSYFLTFIVIKTNYWRSDYFLFNKNTYIIIITEADVDRGPVKPDSLLLQSIR